MNSEALSARIENLLGSSPPGRAENPPAKPPPIPDHELIACIGGGSYGEVWLARSATGAWRAVKIVWRSRFPTERPYEREFHGIVWFEPISRSHPGVINVLHVGRDDAAGCFYYVMELADDVNAECKVQNAESTISTIRHSTPHSSLFTPHSCSPRTLAADLRAHGRMSVIDTVALGVQLANALGHVHRHGLVHRDVKPSNVIFIDGQAKLADIGLVTGMNEAHSFVGTEGFIPPEGPGSAPADIFSLGRLLYEAATGKDRCEFPMLPADLDQWPQAERDALLELNEVLARACAANPKDRHANVAALAGDLNLILAGRSVRRAYGIERRLRNATRVSIAALAVVALSAGVVWFLETQRRQGESRAAQEALLRRRAEAAERETQQQLYAALLEQARATVRSGELGQRVKALDAIRRAAAISNSAPLRGVALAAHALPDLRFERELPYGDEFTMRLVDASFERIALSRDRGPVEIRSTFDQRLLATLPASTNLAAYYAEWSADGRFLAVNRNYGVYGPQSDKEVWSVKDARRLLLLRDVPYDAMCFHPRLPRLLVGRKNGAEVWDLENGAEVGRVSLNGTPRWLRFAPDAERIAASYEVERDWVVSVHRLTTGELVASNTFDNTVGWFDWHPSGEWLSVPDYDGAIHRMDARTGEKRLLGRHKAEAPRTEFSPDGAYLMSGGWEREVICWDARALNRAFNIGLNGYAGRFRSDGRAYALETRSGVQLHVFERASGHREFAEELGSRLTQAAFSQDGRWVAAAGAQQLGLWDLQSRGPGALATNGWGTRVHFAANGELLADRPDACYRWRVSAGTNAESPPQMTRLELAPPERFASLCPIPNAVVLTGGRGSAVVAPNELGVAASRDWKRTVAGLSGASPDGRWLALYPSFTSYLFVHGLPDLGRIAILTNASSIHGFQFSPAGDEIAVSCRSEVEFWNTATWQRARTITNFNNQLYSADGRTMWLTAQFRAGGLYDARTLELLMPLPVGAFPLAVSPDGRRLAVSVDLRRLQVWDLVEVRQQLQDLGLDWAEDKAVNR